MLHPKVKQRMEESEEEEEEEVGAKPKIPLLLSNNQVKNFIGQILTGLSQMHSKSIWHRDVTPGNLLITEDSTVKFIDFGISKLAEPEK